jgi:hypothetical protein
MTFKYAEDALGRNVPYLRVMWGEGIRRLRVINVQMTVDERVVRSLDGIKR